MKKAVDETPPPLEKTTVTRLQDGREGFEIREPQNLDQQSRASFDRAVALMREGDFEASIPLFEDVIGHAPKLTAPRIDVAMAYRRTGRPELAEEQLKAALELIPGHPVASNEYGLLLRRDGRFETARQVYEGAIAKFPEYLPVRKNLGILCDLYLADPACALEQYEIYSEAHPDDEEIEIWIADLRIRLGMRP